MSNWLGSSAIASLASHASCTTLRTSRLITHRSRPRAFSPSPRVVSEDTGLAAARAVFADHPVIKARTPGSVGGYAPAKFSFSTRDKQQAKSWKTWNSVAPTGKDTYKLGKFDVVTTQLFGKEVKKPDVVCSSMNVYRGIDEELAEIAAQEAQQEQQASYEA